MATLACPKCKSQVDNNGQLVAVANRVIDVSVTVLFKNGEFVRYAEPSLTTGANLANLLDPIYTVKCPSCKATVPLKEVSVAKTCMTCSAPLVNDESFCASFERDFCDVCAGNLLLKICSHCQYRVECKLRNRQG